MVFEPCTCVPVEKEGRYYIEWIGQYLGTCAYNVVEILSIAFFIVQLVLWLFAQAPQFYENWKYKKVQALHPLFLISWLLGDISNLLGTILSQQLPVQQYTAIYFCIIDVFLLSQWVYYAKIYRPPPDESPLLNQKFAMFGFLMLVNVAVISSTFSIPSFFAPPERALRELLNSETPGAGLRNCQLSIHLQPWEIIIGDISAWISAVLYLGARIPQIVRNYQRKTVMGLSISMFVIICAANAFYGAQILVLRPEINEKFYRSTLPFLLGSLGTIGESLVVVGQWVYYDCYLESKLKEEVVITEEDEDFLLNNKST